ncbi:hypothetical protein ACOMHN_019284 [Nucella lapillus]
MLAKRALVKVMLAKGALVKVMLAKGALVKVMLAKGHWSRLAVDKQWLQTTQGDTHGDNIRRYTWRQHEEIHTETT